MMANTNLAFADKEMEEPKIEMQTYRITIENNWNRRDHLALPGNAHFSPVVAISHNDKYDLVTLGGTTSDVLEPVAELGQTGLIEKDIADAKIAGSVLESIITKNMFVPSQRTQTFEVTVTEEHPFMSLVSMIAPSPDWVIAVSNMKLFNKDQGFFNGVTKLPLYALDGGTESGDRPGNFSINNEETLPLQPVNQLTGRGFNAPFAYVTIEKI